MRAVILIFSLIITLSLSELLIRKIKPQLTFSEAVKLSIDCYAYDPLIPFTLGKNYKCKMVNIRGEYNTGATLNSYGYRGEEFDLEKKPGVTRIMVIGDSMTIGWGVADDVTYPFLLEKNLKSKLSTPVEVINAGYVGGLSVDSYYLYLKNRGLKLKPDILVLGFTVWNDISDLAENVWLKVDKQGLPEQVNSCCHIVDGRIFRNRSIEFKFRYPILRESHLFLLTIETLQKRFNLFKTPYMQVTRGEELMGCVLNPDCIHLFYQEEEKTYKILREIKKLSDENNTKLLVVLFPVDLQLYANQKSKYESYGGKWFPQTGNEDFLQKRLGSFLNQNSISYLDLYKFFVEQKNKDYPFFPIDAHFNKYGTQLVAENISQYLFEKKWLSDK